MAEELPLAEAAARLGMTAEALRMRVRRGRVKGRKDEAGRVWVTLNEPEQPTGHRPDTDRADRDPADDAVSILKAQVVDLQKRLDTAEQAQSEMRRLILSSQSQAAELTKLLPPPDAAVTNTEAGDPQPGKPKRKFWPW